MDSIELNFNVIMVNFNATKELKKEVDSFRQQVISDVIRYRIDHKTYWSKTADRKDYPSVIAGCEYGKEMAAGRSLTGRCYTPRTPRLHPLIQAPIVALAPLGSVIPSSSSGMFYGTCAEDDAATKVLNRLDCKHTQLPTVKDLTFAPPFRPRTLEFRDCCDVCQKVFG